MRAHRSAVPISPKACFFTVFSDKEERGQLAKYAAHHDLNGALPRVPHLWWRRTRWSSHGRQHDRRTLGHAISREVGRPAPPLHCEVTEPFLPFASHSGSLLCLPPATRPDKMAWHGDGDAALAPHLCPNSQDAVKSVFRL